MSPSTLEFTIKKTLVDGFLTIDRGWVINLIGQFVYVGTARNPRLRLSGIHLLTQCKAPLVIRWYGINHGCEFSMTCIGHRQHDIEHEILGDSFPPSDEVRQRTPRVIE